MGHHAEPFELLEVAVDGREVDVGRFCLHLRGEVLGGAVARRGEERSQDQPAGGRRPAPGRPQALDDAGDELVDGRVTRSS